jgi:serine/threonine-protein kinase
MAMLRRLCSLVSVTVFGATLTASPTCFAGDEIMAEALFREGRALMDAGNYGAACPKLAESYSQDPATGTLLALAVCEQESGKTASAWAHFAEALSRAKREGRDDRAQVAREELAAVEGKLSRLTIAVAREGADVPGLAVSRDGKPVGRAVWGTAMPIDPGEHTVEASAPGRRTWKTTVTIGAISDMKTVTVPALEADSSAVVRSPVAETRATPAAESSAAPPDSGPAAEGPPLKTIGLAVGAAGIVGLGLSGVFALRAKSLDDESKADGHCDAQNTCDSSGGSKRDEAMSAATVTTVAFIAGSVLTTTGVTLFLLGGQSSKRRESARAEVAPVIGPGAAAVMLHGKF